MRPREEVEAHIAEQLLELRKYLQDSGYDTSYLSMTILDDRVSANNAYWADTPPIQFHKSLRD